MSFHDEIRRWPEADLTRYWRGISVADVRRCLTKDRLMPEDYLTLLAPSAGECLEAMAQRAGELTVRHFGRTMLLYTPLYLSNHCVNACRYCGFSVGNTVPRRKLSLDEVEAEARHLAGTGLRHILILTGESRRESPVSYLTDCVHVLKRYFASVAIEIYPLAEPEYAEVVAAGADGLTIYQEVYDETAYADLHPRGPKRDYRYRLDAPERGCHAGMRSVSVGALLGLASWRREAFLTGLHADWLQRKFGGIEVGISLPRMQDHAGGMPPPAAVTDRDLVQYLLAYRIFMPRGGVAVSTRERAALRDALVPLGVTRMSAGSCTAVGGRLQEDASGEQFDIADRRSVAQVSAMLRTRGYQAVFKDWERL